MLNTTYTLASIRSRPGAEVRRHPATSPRAVGHTHPRGEGAHHADHQEAQTIKIPEINTDVTKAVKDIAAVAKDATYVVIGAGVLGFQQVQVQRQELMKRLADPKAGLRGPGGRGPHRPERRPPQRRHHRRAPGGAVRGDHRATGAAVAPLEDRLPTQARDLAKQAHVQAKEARTQLRSRIPTAAA